MYSISQILPFLIIICNVVISMQGFSNGDFFNKYKFSVAGVEKGQYYRLITSGFLHADWQHLLFNMLTLYFFSDSLIAIIGGVNYLILYFLALVLGNALSLYFYRRQPYYTAVGASGAVVGILYSFILFEPQTRILVFILPMPAYLFGIAYLLYSLYGMKAKSDNIGHSAHFGGAIAGFAFTLFIYPELWLIHRGTVLLLLIPIVLLFIFRKQL